MKPTIAAGAVLIAGFALMTWWALESGGVAIVRTHDAEGSIRETHVWFAQSEGTLWVEAGTPENPWYVDVQSDPAVTFSSADRAGRFVAQPVVDEMARQKIRSLLREKYGLRDWWVGLIFDTSRSIAVRLVPASGGAELSR